MRNLTCKRLQVDEIWAFVYAKAKNVETAKAAPDSAGDCWTWIAIDADTKLIPSYFVGARDSMAAQQFIGDLALRLANRVQLTSDGDKPYLEAVEQSFGADIDYAMVVKFMAMRPAKAVTALVSAQARSKSEWETNQMRHTSAPATRNGPTSRSGWDHAGSRG